MGTQEVTIQQRPEFGKLYGITHDLQTGTPIIRISRILKVGIGIAMGRAIQVFLFKGKWHIRHGVWDKSSGKEKLVMKTVYQGGAMVNGQPTPNTKEAAEAWHNANKHLAAVSNRPQKVPYFTFSRRVVTEQNGKLSETFEPDFDAIEAHGDLPQRVPVIVTSENAVSQEYQYWTATEMRCHGDGKLAERLVSFGKTEDPNWKEARAAGDKWFLYTPCYKTGCPLAKNECKPHTVVDIQLAYALRLGATAYFTSTGEVTAGRLSSSFKAIRGLIEQQGYSIAGMEMDLVLDHFPANPEGGKPSLQPYIALQMRAKSQEALRRLMAETSWTPVKLEAAQRQLASPQHDGEAMYEAIVETDSGVASNLFAGGSGVALDFEEPVVEPDFDDEFTAPPASSPAATATQQKQDEIGRKLQTRRKATVEPASTPAPVAVVPTPERQQPPWGSQEAMEGWFQSARERMEEGAFIELLRRHSVAPGLQWDDPKAALLFADVSALLPNVDVSPDEELF